MSSWRADGAITRDSIMNAAAQADALLGNDEDEEEEVVEKYPSPTFSTKGSPKSPQGGSLLAQYAAHNAANLKKMKADLAQLDNEVGGRK